MTATTVRRKIRKSGENAPAQSLGPRQVLFRWIKKLLLGARTICPKCEEGSMFESFFQVRKKCSHCQVTLQPYPGDEIGVIVLGHVLLVIPVLLGFLVTHFYTDWSAGQQLSFVFFLMTAFLMLFYRNIKGVWIGFVYLLTGLRRRL